MPPTTLSGSLNPSFNGIWSWRPEFTSFLMCTSTVLILLLMEYGHGEAILTIKWSSKVDRLNPSFNGIWSWSPHNSRP